MIWLSLICSLLNSATHQRVVGSKKIIWSPKQATNPRPRDPQCYMLTTVHLAVESERFSSQLIQVISADRESLRNHHWVLRQQEGNLMVLAKSDIPTVFNSHRKESVTVYLCMSAVSWLLTTECSVYVKEWSWLVRIWFLYEKVSDTITVWGVDYGTSSMVFIHLRNIQHR